MTLCLREMPDTNSMDQNELKKAVAKAALAHIPHDCIVGVGTGSTANFFIDELAGIKGRIEGAVASSEASAARLKNAGIRVFDLNVVSDVPVYVDGEIGRASCRERVYSSV